MTPDPLLAVVRDAAFKAYNEQCRAVPQTMNPVDAAIAAVLRIARPAIVEECARQCEAMFPPTRNADDYRAGKETGAEWCADAIRALAARDGEGEKL